MLAFLEKADRKDVLRYVHGGWTSALVAGGATWLVATYAIGISGASRELTEGFGSLFAAVVLLSVGIWMHGKAQAGQWQRYIQEKLARALGGQSGWLLFGLAFVVVYREVFETILFFAALWSQGNGAAMRRWNGRRRARARRHRVGDAAVQPATADRQFLPLQLLADGRVDGGARGQGCRRVAGGRLDRYRARLVRAATFNYWPVPHARDGRGSNFSSSSRLSLALRRTVAGWPQTDALLSWPIRAYGAIQPPLSRCMTPRPGSNGKRPDRRRPAASRIVFALLLPRCPVYRAGVNFVRALALLCFGFGLFVQVAANAAAVPQAEMARMGDCAHAEQGDVRTPYEGHGGLLR